MKKTFALCLMMMLAFVFYGCNHTIDENTPSRGVSEQQIVQDISENAILSGELKSKFVPDTAFHYIKHQINKRQINELNTNDVIYADIIGENNYIHGEFSVVLTYNFYDIGGWVLDDIKINSKTLSPLKAADSDMIILEMTNIYGESFPQVYTTTENWKSNNWDGYGELRNLSSGQSMGGFSDFISNFQVTESELLSNKNECRIYISLTSCKSSVKGYISLSFDSKFGWEWSVKYRNISKEDYHYPLVILTEKPITDISVFLGTYSGHLPLTPTRKLEIVAVDEKSNTITYRWDNGKLFTKEFSLTSGRFTYNDYLHDSLYFNPEKEQWEHYYNDKVYVFKKQNK